MIRQCRSSVFLTVSLLSAAGDLVAADEVDESVAAQFARHTYQSVTPDGRAPATLSYRLLTPDPLKGGRRYPLVLFLHGAGRRGTDNEAQLRTFPALMAQPEYRRKHPCFLVAPQCPPGRRWDDELDAVIALLNELIERHPVDRRRIYLTGFSMGGFGAWSLAAKRPDLFAAVAPAEGGGDVRTAHRLVDLPIRAVHGDDDSVVPVGRTRQMIQAIERAGGSPQYTELAGIGHNSWPRGFTGSGGVIAWMFAQRRPWFDVSIDWPLAWLLVVDIAAIGVFIRLIWKRRRVKGAPRQSVASLPESA